MARRPSLGELFLGGMVVSLLGFVAAQVVASPRPGETARAPVLSPRDSAAITHEYRAQIGRQLMYRVPDWLSDVHLARLRAAAARDLATRGAAQVPPESIREILTEASPGTYFLPMIGQDRRIVTRWRASEVPIHVWVQPQSTQKGFSPELVGPARRAFTAWNEVDLGVRFDLVDDSTAADVHVTWSSGMPRFHQIGSTFRMTDGSGWIAFSHVVLSTGYDIYTVQNAARHEAGHVLGLGHSPDQQDIMAAATEGRQVYLTEADRKTVALLYRLPAGPLPPGTLTQ